MSATRRRRAPFPEGPPPAPRPLTTRALGFRWSAREAPASVADYRVRARRVLPDMVWAFIEGAAEDRVTVDGNRDAFRRWSLRTRVLPGHGTPRLDIEVAGEPLALPVLLAPTGGNGLVHWTGEVGAAQAAERAGTRSILSTVATCSPEEVAAATTGGHFFQVFPWSNPDTGARELNAALIRRAERSGYRALVVTADVPVLGNREWERRHGIGRPPVVTPRRVADAALHPRWLYRFLRHRGIALRALRRQPAFFRADEDWSAVAWIRDQWHGPLFVKGIVTGDDAVRALEVGADGIIVSNHGGRQLDGAVASLDALPAIADRVAGRAEILLDGGVRRGTDIVKALCLGASAVCIGRPFLYGLAVDGPAGVSVVLDILREELERTLILMGVGDLGELGASWLARAGPDPGP